LTKTYQINIAADHEVDDLPLWRDKEAYAIVKDHLKKHNVEEDHFVRLVASYREHAHKQRTRGLTEDIDSILMSDLG
jgi:hypothetical protein